MRTKGQRGSIIVYNKTGRQPLLKIKVKDKQKYLGYPDTPLARKAAKLELDKLYNEVYGITKEESQSSILISQAWDEYRRNYLVNKADKTILGYVDSYKKIVTADLVLNRENIELLVDNFIITAKEKMSNTSINIYIRQFRAFIFWCVDRHYLDRINFKQFRQTENRKEIKIYSETEIKQLIDYFSLEDVEFSRLLEFLLNTGARINETLELTWQDVKDNEIIFSNKTNKKFESIPLSNRVRRILDKQNNEDKVFRWLPSSQSYLLTVLNKGMKSCSISKQGRAFHEFRKTFLYRLFQSGVPLEIAYKLMRHHSIQVTMNYYAYFDRSTLVSHLDNLEKNFSI